MQRMTREAVHEKQLDQDLQKACIAMEGGPSAEHEMLLEVDIP